MNLIHKAFLKAAQQLNLYQQRPVIRIFNPIPLSLIPTLQKFTWGRGSGSNMDKALTKIQSKSKGWENFTAILALDPESIKDTGNEPVAFDEATGDEYSQKDINKWLTTLEHIGIARSSKMKIWGWALLESYTEARGFGDVNKPTAAIDLFVDPSLRRSGLGAYLKQEALNLASQKQIEPQENDHFRRYRLEDKKVRELNEKQEDEAMYKHLLSRYKEDLEKLRQWQNNNPDPQMVKWHKTIERLTETLKWKQKELQKMFPNQVAKEQLSLFDLD